MRLIVEVTRRGISLTIGDVTNLFMTTTPPAQPAPTPNQAQEPDDAGIFGFARRSM